MRSLFIAGDIAQYQLGMTYRLDGEEGHHAQAVMRLAVGDQADLTDLVGNFAQGQVSSTGKGFLEFTLLQTGITAPPKVEITLIQALVKSDRVKVMLELAVESGASALVPWQASNCISKWQGDSYEKWWQSIASACKQSRRTRAPKLSAPLTTKALIADINQFDLVLVAHESVGNSAYSLGALVNQAILDKQALKRIAILIGPEGGISEHEIEELCAAGALTFSLGEQVLRSAHAGIAAVFALSGLLGLI
jgi:16S rRNA (uracil1498-N3)-methyltransferase